MGSAPFLANRGNRLVNTSKHPYGFFVCVNKRKYFSTTTITEEKA
jgi:hypothetical protein